MRSRTSRRRRASPLLYLLVVVVVLIAGFPVYWMVDTALSSQAQLYSHPQGILPTFANLRALFKALGHVPLAGMLGNSAFIAIGTTVLSVVFGIMCAYALSRFRFYGKGAVSFLFFATQMLPEGIFLIPIYSLFITFGLVNSLWGLVLVNAAFTLPVSTFIIKSGIDAIPFEIEEAARVDNCPRLGILVTVLVPLVLPSIASAAILAFFAGWSEFMFAATFLTSRGKWPASVQLSVLVTQPGVSMPVVMAVALVFSVPAIVFFLLIQRRIVSGLTAGAVKG